MTTSNTHRFASLAFAAIVTVAMLLGVNQLAAGTTADGAHVAATAVAAAV